MAQKLDKETKLRLAAVVAVMIIFIYFIVLSVKRARYLDMNRE